MREASGGFAFSAQDALDRAVRERERLEREVAAASRGLAAHRQALDGAERAAAASKLALRERRCRLAAEAGGLADDPRDARGRIASLRAAAARDQSLVRLALERERALASVLAALRIRLAQASDAQRLLEQVREARLREFRAAGRQSADRQADDAAIEVWRRGHPRA